MKGAPGKAYRVQLRAQVRSSSEERLRQSYLKLWQWTTAVEIAQAHVLQEK